MSAGTGACDGDHPGDPAAIPSGKLMADESSHSDAETTRLDLGDDDSPTIHTTRAANRPSAGRAVFEPGDVLAGRYRITRFIARGGMGEVYEAEDLELQGSVALKTIRPEVADDAVAIERFRREIQIARRVTHPNVCRVFDVSHDQSSGMDVMFVTMELLDGQTLRELVVESGPLSTAAALPIARQIADGLAAAHRAGIIHRDLKSANVMLVPEEGQSEPRVVVTDFGLARAAVVSGQSITSTGDIVGSPAYMSPEQIEGKPLSPATDIYAFGVVLYEMVTRGHPFEAETPLASVLKRLREPPASPRTYVPDLDPVWEQVILRCLEREPGDRFPDPRAAVQALERGTKSGLPSRRRAWIRRLEVGAGMAAIVALMGILAARLPWRTPPPAPAARVAPAARRVLAVIGFRNQSGQGDIAWLSTALTEMLTTEVAAAEQVRTIPGDAVARTKRELGIGESEGLTPPVATRMHEILGTDYLVSGSYTALGPPGSRQLRLDVQLQEGLGGNVIASFAETGTEERLFDLVARAGSRLREKLGVAAVSPEAASGILASLPSSPTAVRYYAEGLNRLREYDKLGARTLLEKAIAADPDFPLAHAQLAGVYRDLGYDGRAKQEAQTALRYASSLPRESRLLIEAQAHVQNDRFAQAAEIYQALWRFYPDNLDYATGTAFALVNAGNAKEALSMIDALKKTWADPRVDLAEADAAEATSDYKRARIAAARAAQKADARGQRLMAARARLSEGYALLRVSELPAARAAFEDCRRRYESVGDRTGVGQALGGIGSVLLESGQLDEALAIFQAEAKIARETGSRVGEAADLHNVAMVLQRKGDAAGAKAALRRALALQRDLGNDAAMAATLSMLAQVSADGGDLSEATRLYEQALALNERVGAAHAAANNRNNLAVIRKTKGDLDGAERLFREALTAYRKTQDDAAVADALNNLAVIQRSRGDLAGAEKSYQEAEQVYRRMNSRSDLAMVAVNVSSVLVDRGDLAGAKEKAEAALAIWRSTGERSLAAYALMAIADVEARRGDLQRAEAIVRDALQQRREMGEESTAAESQLALADLALEGGRAGEAEQMARNALATFEKEERADVMAVAKTILCRLAIARRDFAGARQLLQSADALATSSGDAAARFTVSLTDAKLATASGRPQVAIAKLASLLALARGQGFVSQQFETRLALAEATMAAARPSEARRQLEALEWDANAKGFGLVARKAERMRMGSRGLAL